MSDVHRGGIYRQPATGRRFLVVSVDALNAAGTAIVVEVAPESATGARGMLTVAIGEDQHAAGGWAFAWRINYVRVDRLGDFDRDVPPDTLARVITAITAAIEP